MNSIHFTIIHAIGCFFSSKLVKSCSQRLKHSFHLVSDTVLVSRSEDIYLNLALEDWLFQNLDFKKYSALLIWKNKPAVVIGRHQNPYLESDVWKISQSSVDLARRNSGGGAVFHDKGNLNLSFLKSRDRYNRYSNLELVIAAIKSRWDVDLTINTREDILLEGFYKVMYYKCLLNTLYVQ